MHRSMATFILQGLFSEQFNEIHLFNCHSRDFCLSRDTWQHWFFTLYSHQMEHNDDFSCSVQLSIWDFPSLLSFDSTCIEKRPSFRQLHTIDTILVSFQSSTNNEVLFHFDQNDTACISTSSSHMCLEFETIQEMMESSEDHQSDRKEQSKNCSKKTWWTT